MFQSSSSTFKPKSSKVQPQKKNSHSKRSQANLGQIKQEFGQGFVEKRQAEARSSAANGEITNPSKQTGIKTYPQAAYIRLKSAYIRRYWAYIRRSWAYIRSTCFPILSSWLVAHYFDHPTVVQTPGNIKHTFKNLAKLQHYPPSSKITKIPLIE